MKRNWNQKLIQGKGIWKENERKNNNESKKEYERTKENKRKVNGIWKEKRKVKRY